MFRGFIFILDWSQKENTVLVTAYDQIRYLSNEISYISEGYTIDKIMSDICSELNLFKGECDSSGTQILANNAPFVFNSVPAIDIIRIAIEQVRRAENRLLVLYDDFGKLTIKDISKMKSNYLIESAISGDIHTTVTIDDSTYNRVRLKYSSGSETELDGVFVVDGDNQDEIGVLSITLDVNENQDGTEGQLKDIGETYLKIYNTPTRQLTFDDVLGDTDVRGGTFVTTSFDLDIYNYGQAYVVSRVMHKISDGFHTMDLQLEGHDIL